jgi:hypothetical protein
MEHMPYECKYSSRPFYLDAIYASWTFFTKVWRRLHGVYAANFEAFFNWGTCDLPLYFYRLLSLRQIHLRPLILSTLIFMSRNEILVSWNKKMIQYLSICIVINSIFSYIISTVSDIDWDFSPDMPDINQDDTQSRAKEQYRLLTIFSIYFFWYNLLKMRSRVE